MAQKPLIILASLIAALLICAIDTRGMSGVAAFYPRFLIALGLAFAVLSGLQWLVLPSRQYADGELHVLTDGRRPELVRLAGVAVLICLYTIALPHLGFIVASILFLTLSMIVVGLRRPLVILASSTVFTVLFSLALRTVVYVPMPMARPDEWLDLFVYRMGW